MGQAFIGLPAGMESLSLGLYNQNKNTSHGWCRLLLPNCIIFHSSSLDPTCLQAAWSWSLKQLLVMFRMVLMNEDHLQLRSSQRIPFSG